MPGSGRKGKEGKPGGSGGEKRGEAGAAGGNGEQRSSVDLLKEELKETAAGKKVLEEGQRKADEELRKRREGEIAREKGTQEALGGHHAGSGIGKARGLGGTGLSELDAELRRRAAQNDAGKGGAGQLPRPAPESSKKETGAKITGHCILEGYT